MIYFFDINLKLKKIVNPDNALSAIHEHELNNHIIGSMVMDMSYAKTFIDDVDHFGYYYKGNFYLHRIRRVEDSHISETVTVTGRHIFFEDMLYGLPIDDFRPQNRDAAYILKNTIDTNTRWRTVMTDVTGTLSTNFYRQVPWDVIEWVTENFRVEFEPVILFDGQKINGYQLHVANKLGVNKHKRIPFSRVTELDYEIDYSEIITSLAGYGKGEEVGEGYGRRINIADVDFSRNGVVSPIGSHYMEDRNITAIYGKDNGEPKYGIVEFSDIEDDELLAEAMYESYLEMSRPKMAFSASVIDVGDVGIGDTQTIVRPESNVFYSVRIHKLAANLHDPEDADVELGDYEHFKESKLERKSRQADKEWKKRYASAITQMKRDWDTDYESVIEQIEQSYEQAVIDANAEVAAAEVRMQAELDTQRQQMTENINTARDIAIEQAEADAEAKADAVQGNLESFEQTHQQLYDSVTSDIMDIDTFLGDLTIPLNKQFENMEIGLNQSITAVDGRIDAMVTNFGDSGKSLSQFVLDVDSIEQTVAANDDWLGTHGSNVLQTVDGFEQKVWQADIVNPNLIPFSDFSKLANVNEWWGWGVSNLGVYEHYMIVRNTNSSSNIAMRSPLISGYVTPGETYTLSWRAGMLHSHEHLLHDEFEYLFVMYALEGNVSLPSPSRRLVGSNSVQNLYEYTLTFTMPETTDLTRILIGTYTKQTGVDVTYRFTKPKLEMGVRATPYDSSFSMLEHRADEISLQVQEIEGNAVYQSDVTINSDSVDIGSIKIDGDTIGSVLSVSPSGIDAVTEKMRITGDLAVAGDIESISLSAIEANFGRVQTAILTSRIIDASMIQTKVIDSNHIRVNNALVEDIMAQNIFAQNVKTLGIEAIYADLRSVNSEIMTSNIIKSNWLDVDTALFDRFTANEAFIDRLTVKAANVRDLEAVTIDAVQANLTTVMNSMGEVEGGLTIRRPDGAIFVQNGLERFGHPVPLTDYRDINAVEFDGKLYTTAKKGAQVFKIGYGDHAGRYYNLTVGVGLRWDSASNSIDMGVTIRPQNTPSGVNWSNHNETFPVVRNTGTDWYTISVPLGTPTYEAMSFTIEFYRKDPWESVNYPQIRTGRSWVSA